MVAAVCNAALWLVVVTPRVPLVLFYPAIAVSAWFGGFWPGVAALLLAIVVSHAVSTGLWSILQLAQGEIIALSTFFAVGISISLLTESLRRQTTRERAARQRAEHAEREAHQLTDELRTSQLHLAVEVADMRRLHELNARVLKEHELTPALRLILEGAVELLGAQKGHVRLYDAREQLLKMVVSIGFDQQALGSVASVPHDFGVSGAVLSRRERVVVEDVETDQIFSSLAPLYKSTGFVAMQATPLLSGDGSILGMLSTHFSEPHRPTDRQLRFLDLYAHQAERAIERSRFVEADRLARRQAEDANRLKDEFLSTVSHELRTPLTAILGWADMLRSGRLVETRRGHALEVIYSNAQRQVQLIGDLLDVARIMSGKLRLDRARVDLVAVVQGAVEVVEPAADAKRIQLVIDDDVAGQTVYGDAARLQQVVWNLLSNAVKFTPEGGAVHIRVSRQDSNNSVDIAVTDTGRGIAHDFLPFVFEPFRQADASTTRTQGGLGLGLSIVRHLVEAHGGTVHAESAGEALGATFTVRLPVALALPGQPSGRLEPKLVARESSASATTRLALEGVSVLVVDDDTDAREVIAESLQCVGAAVVQARSAVEALEHLEREPVDIVLADIAMPGEDGYSLIRRIRQRRHHQVSGIPAVALTSLVREEDRTRALSAGFQLHLAKPIDAQALTEAVASLVRRIEAQ